MRNNARFHVVQDKKIFILASFANSYSQSVFFIHLSPLAFHPFSPLFTLFLGCTTSSASQRHDTDAAVALPLQLSVFL